MTTPFDEAFLKKLSALSFLVKKTLLAGAAGEKFLRQRGGRLEFSEYRDYSPGDESRYIDWNVFARSEKLFVKEFSREESTNVYLVLDVTKSMHPAGNANKLDFAKQLAVALGYVALVAGHHLRCFGFRGEEIISAPEFHREPDVFNLMQFLEPVRAQGTTQLELTLPQLEKFAARKGLIILISDLLSSSADPSQHAAVQKGFRRFLNRGFEISLIHLMAPSEIDISLSGPVRLKDAETGQQKTLFLNQQILTDYYQSLNKFIADWQDFARKHEMRYFNITTAQPLEKVVLDFLRKGGLLK